MQKLNVFSFYKLGNDIHFLTSLSHAGSNIGAIIDIEIARGELRRFLSRPLLSLPTVPSEGESLLDAIDRLLPDDWNSRTDIDLDSEFPGVLVSEVEKAATAFETVLAAELARADIYSVSKKGIYDTTDLIDRVELILSEKVRAVLPPQAAIDLRQAGRCLAFEIPTAAGFHLFRAVESVIKAYYEKLAKQPWPHRQQDWGKYIDELKKLGAPDKITTALDQTRKNYRNPLVHPEENLDLDEGLSLFGMVQGVLTSMLQAMLSTEAPKDEP